MRHGRHLRSARPVIHRKVVSQMSVDVRIPTTLRTLTGGANKVTVEGSTVSEVLAALDAAHPGFASRLLDDSGAIQRFVNVFVADQTSAIPPVPRTWFNRYLPATIWPESMKLRPFASEPAGCRSYAEGRPSTTSRYL